MSHLNRRLLPRRRRLLPNEMTFELHSTSSMLAEVPHNE